MIAAAFEGMMKERRAPSQVLDDGDTAAPLEAMRDVMESMFGLAGLPEWRGDMEPVVNLYETDGACTLECAVDRSAKRTHSSSIKAVLRSPSLSRATPEISVLDDGEC
jgi:hypothetical protein